MSASTAGPAIRVAALYAVFGCAWILGSDRLVGWLTADPAAAGLLQTLKGWAFVLFSAGLVYGLVRRERRKWQEARESLLEAEESLEEAEGLYERVLAGISDAVLVIHAPSQRIVDCKPAALGVFGYARDELVGSSTEILHVDREQFERFGAAGDPVLERGEPFRAEWVLRRKDGETFRTEQVVSLIGHEADDEPEYAVSVIRDVSERVERERELELDDEASIHVYRVVQEALTNVARHAEADGARVVISGEEDELVVRVLDDGVGLDPESVRSLHSHGLLGMQERAHILGGELELLNRREGGAEVRLRFPRPEGKVA